MCILAISLSQVAESILIGFALLLAFAQFVFPARARNVYLVLKELRGFVVSPQSPALSDYALRVAALAAILSFLFIEALILDG